MLTLLYFEAHGYGFVVFTRHQGTLLISNVNATAAQANDWW